MQSLVKVDVKELLNSKRPLILDLGCGPHKKNGRVGIDILDLPGVDVVSDLNKGFPFLPDACVDEIHSKSLLEHIDNLEFFLRETLRVMKPSGRSYAFVPHFSNPYYYSDYTHSKFFGLYTMYYFTETKFQLKRKVPNFYTNIRLKVISVDYVFVSPFRGRNLFKRVFGWFVNLSRYTKEFYEENLCYIVPCYGMNIVYERDDQK